MTPRHAIILAAGQGLRLRGVVDDRPKGLVEVAGEPLVARSIRCLRAAGIVEVTIVAGYCADQYRAGFGHVEGVSIVLNDAFASSGSMASLAIGLDACRDRQDVLVLESDIIYEPRALTELLAASASTATLVSGVTGAGDEVWVDAVHGRLRAMSKDPATLGAIAGEFVGITRLSADAARAMREAFAAFVAIHGHARMDYETGALVAIARAQPVDVVIVPDLQWGEIDDERQYARVSALKWSDCQPTVRPLAVRLSPDSQTPGSQTPGSQTVG
jgi:2-aminoethylphosphonate-pyruvate transaminase